VWTHGSSSRKWAIAAWSSRKYRTCMYLILFALRIICLIGFLQVFLVKCFVCKILQYHLLNEMSLIDIHNFKQKYSFYLCDKWLHTKLGGFKVIKLIAILSSILSLKMYWMINELNLYILSLFCYPTVGNFLCYICSYSRHVSRNLMKKPWRKYSSSPLRIT
jgi:hypothetical protein